MTTNEISKILAYIRKHQNNVCIKLGIAIFVCFVLCFSCFFVERKDDDDIGQTQLQDDRHSTEKLIQIKMDQLYEESTHNRADISLQSQNDFAESSGNYLETTEFYLVPDTTSSVDEIFESDFEGDSSDTKTDAAQATPDLQEMIEVLSNNSGEFIEKNTIEKLFENLPKYSETQTPNLLAELNDGHLTTDAAQGQYRKGSALKRNFDFEKKNSMASRNSDHSEPYAIEAVENEDERYFPNEYAFDEDSPEDSAEDESDEEFIFTNYDNGDYMELRDHHYSEEDLAEKDVQIPSLIDSLFGKMSTLLTPIGKPPNFASKLHQPPHGLSNFKDSLLKTDHLQVESSYVPIWQPQLDKTALHQFWNPKKSPPKPSRSELRHSGKNNLPVLNSWFKVSPDNRYSNQMENSFKMFENFFNPKKS